MVVSFFSKNFSLLATFPDFFAAGVDSCVLRFEKINGGHPFELMTGRTSAGQEAVFTGGFKLTTSMFFGLILPKISVLQN